MNYYTMKKAAIQDIEQGMAEGSPKNNIIYKVTKKYGLSQSFVIKQIELFEALTEEKPKIKKP